MGAWSFSPSPITTSPSKCMLPKPMRMASTAAPSPASLLPRPSQRAEARAAASVTRTISRARFLSGASAMICSRFKNSFSFFLFINPQPCRHQAKSWPLRQIWESRWPPNQIRIWRDTGQSAKIHGFCRHLYEYPYRSVRSVLIFVQQNWQDV